MSKTTAPPSRAQENAPRTRRRADAREWGGSIRLSGFAMIMLGLVILAGFVLVPSVGTYLDQRAQIAALQQSVKATTEQVAALEAERDRWSDPAYITTQARERLYYVRPGEVVYLIDNDLPASAIPPEQDAVSKDLAETKTDWMAQFVRSVTAAGTAQTVTGAPGR